MSSFQRRFASLLSTDNSSPSSTNTTTATTTTASAATSTKTQSPTSASTATANSLTPDMALFNSPNIGSNMRLSPADRQHHQRPVSEILKPESFISPETQALDKWFEDLQQYESSLESMATASLDPKYKEEVQHVDQWFRYLNEAERTATIYTLLQHSTQVQIRFFITVLQQMDGKDPVGALLSPAHPEKVDMQAQLTGAMKKAELEASQKLLSVLPYQAGQVIARPNANAIRRQHIDRHSFALGDTEEYDHLFSRVPGDYALRNSYAGQQHQQQQQQRGMFDHPINTRPKSVIEGNSSIFSNDWSYGNFGQHHQQQQQQQQRPNATVGANRPKSADISNWSFGLASSVSSKSVRDSSKDSLASPWSGLSPTVSTFGEQQQQQQQQSQQQQHNEMDQQLSMMANKWSLRGGGGGAGGNGSSNRSSVILSDDTNGFKRRATTMSIPETADEQYHVQSPPTTPAPVVNNPAATNIVLSLYDESASTPSTSTQLFGHNEKRGDSFYKAAAGESSPVPSQSTSMNLFSMSTTNTRPVPKQQQQQHTFGQFLNPNDRIHTSESVEAGYHSDHSDTSNRSNGSKSYHYSGNKKKAHYAGNNGGYYNNALRNGGGGGNHAPPPPAAAAATTAKENKKNIDVVDMSLLEDVPAWLRSLRLHKYNPIFETMKWQDMLKMDDEALLNQGVAALGARRKLLKVFDQVKAHCAAQNITY